VSLGSFASGNLFKRLLLGEYRSWLPTKREMINGLFGSYDESVPLQPSIEISESSDRVSDNELPFFVI
jgi:hypothetical protein